MHLCLCGLCLVHVDGKWSGVAVTGGDTHIFLPLTDTVPAAGTYKCDTTTAVSTFLPGMDFEGNPTGTYILRINDSKISSIILCNDSSFVLSRNGETTDIQFNLIADKKQYKLHFCGVLKYEDKRQHL